jgi:ankyrin repeat protein
LLFLDTNCALANKRGFNALQHAALKGNSFACTAICRRYPDLVDRRKDDGFSALHLAALNGHADAVNALVYSHIIIVCLKTVLHVNFCE